MKLVSIQELQDVIRNSTSCHPYVHTNAMPRPTKTFLETDEEGKEVQVTRKIGVRDKDGEVAKILFAEGYCVDSHPISCLDVKRHLLLRGAWFDAIQDSPELKELCSEPGMTVDFLKPEAVHLLSHLSSKDLLTFQSQCAVPLTPEVVSVAIRGGLYGDDLIEGI